VHQLENSVESASVG